MGSDQHSNVWSIVYISQTFFSDSSMTIISYRPFLTFRSNYIKKLKMSVPTDGDRMVIVSFSFLILPHETPFFVPASSCQDFK